MTSYPFFKMAAIESEIYFRVRFWWWHSFGRLKSTGIPNFDGIYYSTAEIKLLPVSEERTVAILEFISGFYFCLIFVIGVSFCIDQPNFVVIGWLAAKLWRHIDFFSRWRPAAILDLISVILDHPRSALFGLSLLLKFGLDRIYSFGDIVIFIFLCFGLKLPIHSHFFGGGAGGRGVGDIFLPNDVTHHSDPPKGTSLCGNTSFEP